MDLGVEWAREYLAYYAVTDRSPDDRQSNPLHPFNPLNPLNPLSKSVSASCIIKSPGMSLQSLPDKMPADMR
jgi:hypothetical protein